MNLLRSYTVKCHLLLNFLSVPSILPVHSTLWFLPAFWHEQTASRPEILNTKLYIFLPSQSNSCPVTLTYCGAQKHYLGNAPSEFFWQDKFENYCETCLGLQSQVAWKVVVPCAPCKTWQRKWARGQKHHQSISIWTTLACQTGFLTALVFCHNIEHPMGIINMEANSFRMSK